MVSPSGMPSGTSEAGESIPPPAAGPLGLDRPARSAPTAQPQVEGHAGAERRVRATHSPSTAGGEQTRRVSGGINKEEQTAQRSVVAMGAIAMERMWRYPMQNTAWSHTT